MSVLRLCVFHGSLHLNTIYLSTAKRVKYLEKCNYVKVKGQAGKTMYIKKDLPSLRCTAVNESDVNSSIVVT